MIGFILTRHVNSKLTNKYWIECVKQIRQIYKNNIIMIIDDNSNYDYVNYIKYPNILNNCVVIQSQYKARGELLPYYYFYKNKLFDKAFIIHDSVFIKSLININEDEEIKFLWQFNNHQWDDRKKEEELISYLNHNNELLQIHCNTNLWHGCFGVMAFIHYDFLKHIVEKYNFFILLNHVTTKHDRCCLERVFAVICNCENKKLIHDSSIFGIIHNHVHSFKYDYNNYLHDKSNENLKIVKVWSGR